MDIEHISVSRKKTYDTCAQQYKYRYHLKTPRPGEEPFYFVYGKLIHKIAEEYVREKAARPIGEIATDMLRGKIEIDPGVKAPPLPNEYKKRLEPHLRAVQKFTEKVGTDGHLEYEFKYDLDPPHGRYLYGFIDRLILKNGKAYIIDYKTTKKGKWRVNNETVKYDLQLRAYSRVVQLDFGIEPENIRAALYYLEGEDVVAVCYSQNSLLLAEADLKSTYLEIEKSDADKVWGTPGPHCNQCDYKTLCPFAQRKTADIVWDGDMSNL